MSRLVILILLVLSAIYVGVGNLDFAFWLALDAGLIYLVVRFANAKR